MSADASLEKIAVDMTPKAFDALSNNVVFLV